MAGAVPDNTSDHIVCGTGKRMAGAVQITPAITFYMGQANVWPVLYLITRAIILCVGQANVWLVLYLIGTSGSAVYMSVWTSDLAL